MISGGLRSIFAQVTCDRSLKTANGINKEKKTAMRSWWTQGIKLVTIQVDSSSAE
jgi:hypothetical protein